jgi:hypothetical protein
MAGNNGVNPTPNGAARQPVKASSERTPRRIVLLTDGEESEVGEVLAELRGDDVTGKRLHAEIQKQAAAHPGRVVAAEWLGNLGWTRFLWCKK